MSKSRTEYKIVLESNRIRKDWETLEKAFPDRMRECKDFLRNNPEDRTKALGILKKLKPPYRGILQYDITKDNYRVWYRVNKKDNAVVIKLCGCSP